jgi:hypothetical protein
LQSEKEERHSDIFIPTTFDPTFLARLRLAGDIDGWFFLY